MPQRLLCFDIGNTTMRLGVVRLGEGRGEALHLGDCSERHGGTMALPTNTAHTSDSLGLLLMDVLRELEVEVADVAAVVASSVVPAMDALVSRAVMDYLGKGVAFAPADVPIPLENRYERPQEVGSDRLVTAYAAQALLPPTKARPAHIVVDFGTATTFDCVKDGAYLGGLICPGVLSSVRALATNTAKLPQVRLDVDSQEVAIGRSTAESLRQGVVFGFASMVDGLVARLKREIGPATVVATGGFSGPMAKVAATLEHVRPELLLEGLALLYTHDS